MPTPDDEDLPKQAARHLLKAARACAWHAQDLAAQDLAAQEGAEEEGAEEAAAWFAHHADVLRALADRISAPGDGFKGTNIIPFRGGEATALPPDRPRGAPRG